jgi:hypothetical protein
MADIRIETGIAGRDRAEAMKDLRAAMREKNECLEDGAHCDNARRAIINSMRPVMDLDPSYFRDFFKQHQAFAASFNDYKYVEELCVVICAVEAWTSGSGGVAVAGDDPYAAIAWMGGLDLHLHASMYFGFTKQDMLRCFQIVQAMKSLEIDALCESDFNFPELELQDSEDWMLHFVAAVSMKFREGVRAIDARRNEFGVSAALRADILGAIKSTYWWRHMMMSRAIQPAADGLPPHIRERVEAAVGVAPPLRATTDRGGDVAHH